MPDKDQVFIFTNQELSLLKNTFADNDILLFTIRKVLLQFPLTDPEKNLIKMSCIPELIRIIKKRMLPTISNEFPLGQLPSLTTTVTEKLKTHTPAEMKPHFDALRTEIAYLTQQFAVLEGSTEQPIKLSELASLEGKNEEEIFSDTSAYLFLLGYIDPALQMLKVIAGEKTETIEEQTKRMTRDSSK